MLDGAQPRSSAWMKSRIGAPRQFARTMAENPLESRIAAPEHTIQTEDREHVQGQVEQPVPLLLDAHPATACGHAAATGSTARKTDRPTMTMIGKPFGRIAGNV